MITFKDLSKPLKTLVVLDWIIAGIYGLSVLIGFFVGFTSTLY